MNPLTTSPAPVDGPALPASALDPRWHQEWAAHYAAPAVERPARGEELMLRFRLGRETYALPVARVAAAVDAGVVVPLPGRRERIVHGLFHADGQLLLAADLRRLLRPAEWPGDRPAPGGFARMLVLGQPPDTFVVAVDDVPGSFRLKPDLLQPVPHGTAATLAGLARGVLREGGEALTVLDGDCLLAALAADLG